MTKRLMGGKGEVLIGLALALPICFAVNLFFFANLTPRPKAVSVAAQHSSVTENGGTSKQDLIDMVGHSAEKAAGHHPALR